MKQILVIVFPIFLRPFLGEFHPAAGPGGPGGRNRGERRGPCGAGGGTCTGTGCGDLGHQGDGGDRGDSSAAAQGRALLGWPAGETWPHALQKPRLFLPRALFSRQGLPKWFIGGDLGS